MRVDLCQVVDLICLIYHEARNIRHPLRAGKLVHTSQYASLVSLPKNRDDAWRRMSDLRSHAASSGSIEAATDSFERVFGLNLPDVAALYRMPIWKHSAYGGNKWAEIGTKVCDLVDAMTAGAGSRTEELYREIISMHHNTGRVAEKLDRLKAIDERPL